MKATDINNLNKKEKNKKVKAGDCIFPFMYKWKSHDKCFPTEKGEICATSLKKGKRRTLKTYGYCVKKSNRVTIKKLKRKIKIKRRLNVKNKIEKKKIKKNKDKTTNNKKKMATKTRRQMKIAKKLKIKSLNDDLINLLGRLQELMTTKGEHMRARAYEKAAETIILENKNITDINQLKGKRGIGATIMKKFKEYLETGTLRVLERAKTDPIITLTGIHGIGFKNAKKLVEDHGIQSVAQLRENQELLNNVQIKGLRHYEDVIQRIPRKEITQYEKIFEKVFKSLKRKRGSTFKIVGSYLRGASNSGDIDLIITNSQNDDAVFTEFIETLENKGILVEILSKGKKKCLAIGKIKGGKARRIDFMYSSPEEYPFATLYFTGSKYFNVVMRQRAIDLGYTMNEHGLYHLVDTGKKKVKGDKLTDHFPDEQSVFQFLGMIYKHPTERKDGRAVVLLGTEDPMVDLTTSEEKKTIDEVKQLEKNEKIITNKRRTLKKNIKIKNKSRDRLVEFSKKGITVLKKLSENQLSDMIIYANDAYFNKKPVIDDNAYDVLKEYIERTYPDNQTIQLVGAPIDKNKVVLPYEMWSQNKIKPDTNALRNWMKKYKGPFVISGKLDGISALYVQNEDGSKGLYTRGEATKGMDISYLIPYLRFPTMPIGETCAIRGELIIKLSTFANKYEGTGPGKYKNARNFIAGVVNAKKRDPQKWSDMDFVAYEVIDPDQKPSRQMRWLESHDIITVININKKKISNEILSEILVDWRENGEYEYDGIIITNDKMYSRVSKNPEHSFAFKMVLSDQVAEAKVIDVLWSPSKDGLLKPVVQIEPVRLKGVDIEFITAHNAQFVLKNKIGIGALIQLVRSGDVIPKILSVITPSSQPKMPDVEWRWNETHVDAILKNFQDNSVVRLKNVENFFKKLSVVGLGEGNITKIMAAGFDTIPKIIRMSKDDFMTVEGFQTTMATKVYNSIHKKLKEAKLPVFMSATNLFGRGLGSKKFKEILNVYPNIILSKESKSVKIEKVAAIKGFQVKTARAFVDFIPAFVDFVRDIGMLNKLKPESIKPVITNHVLTGKRIVITGFRDKNLDEQIEAVGGKMGSSVSKKTFAVIVKDINDDTGKAETARELGVPLFTKEGFVKKYL